MIRLLKFWKSFFLSARFFVLAGVVISFYIFSFFFPSLFRPAGVVVISVLFVAGADSLLLWLSGNRIMAKREIPPRLSNGDNNPVVIILRNNYQFPVRVLVYDELPVQLQIRNLKFRRSLRSGREKEIHYTVKPVTRGEYHFGDIQVLVNSPFGLLMRRYTIPATCMIPCYPSFIHLRRYEIQAVSNRHEESGHRRLQTPGRSFEFDHIRNYVQGDDVRSINWKASARRDALMINQFRDERSQQVYCIVDAGRTMKAPFDEMTLLDYAINATLVLSDVAVVKNDKAGVMLFSNAIHQLVPASNRRSQVGLIMEQLYNAQTDFSESSFEMMASAITRKIPRRSLIILFTNFEGRISLKRQLPFIRHLAQRHLLLTVFFDNSMLNDILSSKAHVLRDVYLKAIAEQQIFERKFMAEDLQRAGAIPLLTSPARLTVDTVNRYLEIKARKLI